MTVKELADFTGKDERTVQRWIKKAGDKMSSISDKMSSSSSTYPANYTIDEVECILQSGTMSKDAVSIIMENARKESNLMPAVGSTLTPKDLELISTLTASIVSKITENLNGRMSNIETKIEERKSLLPAPSISPRQNVSKIVREYAISNNFSFQAVYNKLYTDFGYRTHINVSERAKNRGMAKIDYIEAEGLIDTLESVAIELFA